MGVVPVRQQFGLLALVFAGKLLILNSALATEGFPVRRADVPATIAVLTFLVVPILWLRSSARMPALLGLNALVTALLVADRIHIRFFGDVLSAAEFAHAGQVMSVTSGVAGRIAVTDAVLFLDTAIGITLWAFSLRQGAPLNDWPEGRRAARLSMLLIACALAVVPIRLIWLDPEGVFQYSTRRREAAAALGLIPYHLYDLGVHVRQLSGRLLISPDDRQRAQQFFDERRSRDRTPSTLFGRAHHRNAILVMAESLTSLPLGLVIEGQEVTPALSRFARTSIHFTNFFDQTHLGTTADAEFASLQGLLPLPDAVIATRYAANHFAGLPAILAEHGYDTLSANVMPGDFWNMRQMHRNLGFARLYFRDEFRDGGIVRNGSDRRSVLRADR